MIFRNTTCYAFPKTLDFSQLETLLDGHRLKPVGPQELVSSGAVSPFGPEHETLTHQVGEGILFCVGAEHRVLPAAAVNELVRKKAIAIEQAEGKKVKGKARKALKEDVIMEMLPKAMIKPGRTLAYLDLKRGWLVVDSSSAKSSETAAILIRTALGSFPAVPLTAEESVSALMTSWLRGEALPEGWSLGDSCELKDPADTASVVRAAGQDLLSEEITHHLDAGKMATKLAINHEERSSFVLGDDLILRKLKLQDVAKEDLKNQEIESMEQEMDANFVLMQGEFGLVFDVLAKAFKVEEAK